MNARWTLALVVIAAALGAWVYFGEIQGDVRKKDAEAAQKRVFALEDDAVTALEFGAPSGLVAHVARDGTSEWKIDAPVTYPAEKDAVERALHVLSKVQSLATISPAPADLTPFGLGAQAHSVKVWSGAGDPKQVFVGGPAPVGGARYFALASDPSKIYTVAAGDLFGLTPSLTELRDKRVLRVPSSAADELFVRSQGELVTHAKRADSGWTVLEPSAAPADTEKIRRTLEELSLARATEFADTPDAAAKDAVAKPELELRLHTPEREEVLAFGRAGDKTWLARAGDPVLLAVSPAVVTAIPARPFDYRAKRVLTLGSDKVHALELTYPRIGTTHRFELGDSDWKSTEPGLELRPLKVEDMLMAVASLDATSIEPQNADKKALGLDPPVVLLRALDDKAQEVGVLSLGDASADKGIPATSSQNGEVWRVSNQLGNELPLSPEAFNNTFVKKPGEPDDRAATPTLPAEEPPPELPEPR
ncbi:MAG TPA: DUF4340 domain-containing protein [Myxococcota bacterium]|nr:DUF4340 domain-containing protein [Myxococcota bacterium]